MERVDRRRALTALLALPFVAGSHAAERAPLIVLDPGHHPSQPGALSARGWYEVRYNDRFVAELVPQLQAAGWRVALTRTSEQELGLAARAAVPAQLGADLFLSIHHDSVQPHYVKRTEYDGRTAYRTTGQFRGTSIFVSGLNPHFEASRRFAFLLGGNISALGREPALHHAEPIKGENRPLLDRKLGIYQYDGLAVLRRNSVPAVLVEIGVLPDPWDEAFVSIKQNRLAVQRAIVRAAVEWWRGAIN